MWTRLDNANRQLAISPGYSPERLSYDVITPSAARGILEAVFFHPGMRFVIDRIHVLNPIEFASIRRNEVSDKISAPNVLSVARGGDKKLFLSTSQSIQQRAAVVLKNVRYVIEAHFEMTDKATESDNPGKFQSILKRRLNRGQSYHQPYLGTREFSARFRLWEGGEINAIQETRDLGFMLLDFDYRNPEDIKPIFFRAKMVQGVISPPDPVAWMRDNEGGVIL
jgi:CRISPR-associated protein Cas5d